MFKDHLPRSHQVNYAETLHTLYDISNYIKNALVLKLAFSSPEPKALGELIVYQSNRRLCVCAHF